MSKSLEVTKQAALVMNRHKGAWQYNEAFLLMYMGKFYKGLEKYKAIALLTIKNEESIVDQCIEFDQKLIIQEPDKKQILFVLGFLYYKKKDNLPLALEYFEKFLYESETFKGYEYLKKHASIFITEIEEKIGISDKQEPQLKLFNELI